MNPYILIPFFTLIINGSLFAYVSALKVKSETVTLYQRYSFLLFVWNVSLILYWSFLPDNWPTIVFKASSFSWIFIGLLFFEFAVRFTNSAYRFTIYFFRGFCLVSFLITISTDLVIAGTIRAYWGDMILAGPLYLPISNFVSAIPTLIGCVILIRNGFRSSNPLLKQQSRLVAYGTILTFLISFATTLLPRYWNPSLTSPPLSGSATLIQSICIFIAIHKYGFMDLKLEHIALRLYSEIREGVILLSSKGTLLFSNLSARRMLHLPDNVGSNFDLKDYLEDFPSDSFFERKEFVNLSVKTEDPPEDSPEEFLRITENKYLEVSSSPISLSRKNRDKVYILRDITEKKVSLDKIRQLLYRLDLDLDLARDIQQMITTRDFPDSPDYKIHSYFQPYVKVGGDILKVIKEKDESLHILFGDVSGYGISAAMVAAMISIAFNAATGRSESADKNLLFIHDLLKDTITLHSLSCAYMRYVSYERKLEYSYGGHHAGLLIRNRICSPLEGSGEILFATPSPKIQKYELNLFKGDRILFYSDGLFEVKNREGNVLGKDHFLEAVASLIVEDTNSMIRSILSYSSSYGEGEVSDDITIFCLEVL
ncbi:SpoIIE family protein phosphatase [Leptospira santarosai]|uniref:Serine/threonine protein phosphatase n=1 Tax=Leptospira santarosai TaxID=28183 RepID=A0AB73MFI7_9LEPT|nr:SpoIIE family protein phosphatase [Leptospira santarosai]AVV50184.1 Stage II sporulation protein E [Leptospira santarosai]EMP82492.1 stage II sporulation protein E [Leptospira santarosai str. CBC1531]MBW9232179.1 SpoIIE family protein phosphatase [Leptospira santarosai]MDI7156934.1 SpoIIE family protein phosphatase [Leptospira santarosai]MDI7164341.1 SpoIIE family protein phosphatase [Leptospira santarosai]